MDWITVIGIFGGLIATHTVVGAVAFFIGRIARENDKFEAEFNRRRGLHTSKR